MSGFTKTLALTLPPFSLSLEHRFVRYSLPPHPGTSVPPCFLTRVFARGPNEKVSEEDSKLGDIPACPFPAMTTDSRHIILVHAAGGGGNPTEENGATVVCGEASCPRR